MKTPTPELIRSLAQDLSTPTAARGWSKQYWVSWTLWLAIYAGAAYGAALYRPDLAHLPENISDTGFWIQSVLWLAAAFACAHAGFESSYPTESKWSRAVIKPLILTALAMVTAFLLTTPEGGILKMSQDHLALELDHSRGGCGGFIALMGIFSIAWMTLVVRRAAPARALEAAAWSAASAGCSGSLFMHLICRFENPLHLAIWHLTPIMALIAVSAVLAPKTLRW